MSKRLNKRQQREQDELALLQKSAVEKPEMSSEEEEEEEEVVPVPKAQAQGKVNVFAALELGDSADLDEQENEDEEEEELELESKTETIEPAQPPSSKSSKKKKKKKPTSTPTDLSAQTTLDEPVDPENPTKSKKKKNKKNKKQDDDDDEIDKALKSLGINPTQTKASSSATGSKDDSYARRKNLLSVESKTLDAESELKRFFGAKVVASAAQSESTRQSRQTKLFNNYIAKIRTVLLPQPKATWPIQSGFGGMSMRQLSPEEVMDLIQRRGDTGGLREGERWYSFEQDAGWRQVHTQFLGAVRSHDPNELQALLSVYNWQIDTLLQMSAIYNQQGDIGAAADYCERALFAYDRCLAPGFSLNGTCRLDFDRVENRPMFLALHRLVTHLARRGLWQTAFSYSKALLSLDPESDPHGILLWMDFLAIKSGNLSWITDASSVFDLDYLPGIAYNKAIVARMQEKTEDHISSEALLREAILSFPQVVAILADKAGINISTSARSHPHFEMRVGHSTDRETPMHLLAHIYAARNAPLWKDPAMGTWFRAQVDQVIENIESGKHTLSKSVIPPSWADEVGGMPLWLVRHAFLSESYMGWIPPTIATKLGHAYDPLPPLTAITQYDDAYYAGVHVHSSSSRGSGMMVDVDRFTERMMDIMRTNLPDLNLTNARSMMRERLERLGQSPEFRDATDDSGVRNELLLDLVSNLIRDLSGGPPRARANVNANEPESEDEWDDEEQEDDAPMPGAFP